MRAARITSVSGGPPPCSGVMKRLCKRSLTSGIETSAENFSANQAIRRRDLDPLLRGGADEIAVGDPVSERAVHLGEEFGDHIRSRHRGKALGDQHRGLAGRVEDQEVLAPLPDPLLGKFGLKVEFGERQPREPGMGAEGVMEKGQHPASRIMRLMPRIML